MKPMTEEQIETVITQAHANVLAVTQVTREERVIDRALTTALRSCFVAGSDHGKAVILERVSEMVVPQIADERTVQLGRSLATVLQWCAARKGRMLGSVGETYVSVLRADDETIEKDGLFFKYAYGSDTNEALSKMATWCAEHMAQASVTPTEPAPPPDPEDAAELCENRATLDAAMNAQAEPACDCDRTGIQGTHEDNCATVVC